MAGMAGPSGSFNPNNDRARHENAISRVPADLIVRFNGTEFLPSDETPLGSALCGNLTRHATQGQHAISFKRPYLVDLCVGGGSAFTQTPLSIKGFVLGESPSGVPSVLQLISSDGRKVRLPVVLVTEKDGEWQLVETSLGWNRELRESASEQDIAGRRVSFNDAGVFLVVLRSGNEGVVPMPLMIHSVVVNEQAKVIKALSKDGRVFEPPPLLLDIDTDVLPPAPSPDDEEYSLAPPEPQATSASNVVPEIVKSPGLEIREIFQVPRRTGFETRAFHMELALRRLVMREKGWAGKEHAELLAKILSSSAEREARSDTALIDTCKQLVLMAGGNTKANLISSLCRKWIEHHNGRILWKELVWRDYYQDLTTIAPLLSSLEADLNRANTCAYNARLADKRKRS